ncbi:MAG TPA: DUF4202 family protein [Thermoanaerobaculia bacterium]|nr:DUF4202 family protein [Thermoanaerobaculia bacterium]
MGTLSSEFPTIKVRLGGEPEIGVPTIPTLRVKDWDSPSFNFYQFDTRINALAEKAEGAFALTIAGNSQELPRAALEVLTRCQRLMGRRNEASRIPLFAGVLGRHRALHDLSKPLVRADYDHALDTWQWLLRLNPRAGLVPQLAALFHDVERLVSEADVRIEHLAPCYHSFKDNHALLGARMAEELLAQAGIGAEMRWRVGRLIAHHEQPPEDPDDPNAEDLQFLNEADALSFFSLNSPGYLAYYGPEQTRRKVVYTLRRLRPAARKWLRKLRLPPEVKAVVAESTAVSKAPAVARGAAVGPWQGKSA